VSDEPADKPVLKKVRFEKPIGPDDIVTIDICLNPNVHPNERIWIPLLAQLTKD